MFRRSSTNKRPSSTGGVVGTPTEDKRTSPKGNNSNNTTIHNNLDAIIHHNNNSADGGEPFQTGRGRVASLVSKSGFADRVLGAEETHKDIPKLQGYLYKENRRGKNQKRFFAVNNSYLNYYRNRNAYKQGKVKGSVNLTQATTICILVRNGKPSRRFAIQTEAEEDNEELCLFLKAKSKQAARHWVEKLNDRRAFWLGPNAPPRRLSTAPLTAVFTSTPSKAAAKASFDKNSDKISDTEDEGWKDRIASDDEEDTDEGFQSARSRDYSEDEALNESQRRRKFNSSSSAGVGARRDSYSSSSGGGEEDDSDEESQYGGGGRGSKIRSSSIFQEYSSALPEGSAFLTTPHAPWSSRFWKSPGCRDLMVRGPKYLTTREKIPVVREPLFECVAVDMFVTDGKIDHICNHPRNRIYQARQRGEKLPFMFVIQFQVPGPPFYSMCVYLAASHPEIVELMNPENPTGKGVSLSDEFPPGMKHLLLAFFRTGSDEFCHSHFKLIPRIVEGPWIVRAGIASKPALIGNKLKNSYFRADGYFELDINIGTNSMVTTLTQLAASYAKLLTMDLAFLIEGKLVETLPEFIIGIVRAMHVDFKFAVPL